MQTLSARNVVLGAGAMGAATAYHLAKRGEPVLLIEQFRIGHERGSSHGAARITRHSYADSHYARLMPEAFRAWRALEADARIPLYVRTGGVSFSPESTGYVAQVAANLRALDVPHRRMTSRQLHQAMPAFAIPETYDAVFEPDAGMLAAARCVAVQVELARQLGGQATRVVEDCPVRSLDLEASKPTLLTDTHRITADRLIVTAGPWTPRLVPTLSHLRPTHQQVLYFRPPDESFQIGQFPVFISKGHEPLDDFYGMPPFLGCGVKAARHGGPEIDPNADRPPIDDDYRQVVRQFLRRHIPALADAPIDREEFCLYTVAPDDHFQIARVANRPDVVVASPCSGHGFKFSCLIGRILADLAQTGQTAIPIDPWIGSAE
jgi:sarcosine oxidase